MFIQCYIRIYVHKCRNPNPGLTTKARGYKVMGQEGSRKSGRMLPRMQESVREYTLTLPKELPH
jgi:hypothetical protein